MSLSASQSRTQQESTDSRIAAAEGAVAGRADNGATLIQFGAGSDAVSIKALDTVDNVVGRGVDLAKITTGAFENAFAQQTALVGSVADRLQSMAETKLTGGASDQNKLLITLGGGVLVVASLALLRRR